MAAVIAGLLAALWAANGRHYYRPFSQADERLTMRVLLRSWRSVVEKLAPHTLLSPVPPRCSPNLGRGCSTIGYIRPGVDRIREGSGPPGLPPMARPWPTRCCRHCLSASTASGTCTAKVSIVTSTKKLSDCRRVGGAPRRRGQHTQAIAQGGRRRRRLRARAAPMSAWVRRQVKACGRHLGHRSSPSRPRIERGATPVRPLASAAA